MVIVNEEFNQYLHFEMIQPDKKEETQTTPSVKRLVMYLHVDSEGKPLPWPHFTVAVKIDEAGRIFGGFAMCSKRDSKSFTKRIGRRVAEGRLQKHPLLLGSIPAKVPNGIVRFRLVKNLITAHVRLLTNKINAKRHDSYGAIVTGRENYRTIPTASILASRLTDEPEEQMHARQPIKSLPPKKIDVSLPVTVEVDDFHG